MIEYSTSLMSMFVVRHRFFIFYNSGLHAHGGLPHLFINEGCRFGGDL